MNEQIQPRPRSYRKVLADYRAHWAQHWALCKLAGECVAYQLPRPILIVDGVMAPPDPPEIPENLAKALAEESDRIRELEYELIAARDRERR